MRCSNLLQVIPLLFLTLTFAPYVFPLPTTDKSDTTPNFECLDPLPNTDIISNRDISTKNNLQGMYRCDTTPAAPIIPWINLAAEELDIPHDIKCVQTNRGGSLCQTTSKYKNAAIAICGYSMGSMGCYRMSFAARTIVQRCEWMGKAGGTFWFDNKPGLRIIVYRG